MACNMTGGSSGGPWLADTTNPADIEGRSGLAELVRLHRPDLHVRPEVHRRGPRPGRRHRRPPQLRPATSRLTTFLAGTEQVDRFLELSRSGFSRTPLTRRPAARARRPAPPACRPYPTFHLKDPRPQPFGYVPPGRGPVDIAGVVRVLEEDGYDGGWRSSPTRSTARRATRPGRASPTSRCSRQAPLRLTRRPRPGAPPARRLSTARGRGLPR